MKKIVKIVMISAAILSVTGIGLVTVGAAMGATQSGVFQEVRRRFHHGFDWDFWVDDDECRNGESCERVAVEANDDVSDVEMYSGNSDTYCFDAKENLEIELRYDELILEEHDAEEIVVEVLNDTRGDVTVRESGETLEIRSSKKLKTRRTVRVLYPRNLKFCEVELSVGAGIVNLRGNLTADSLDINLGTGEFVNEGTLTAAEADLEVGAGSMKLNAMDVQEMSVECGMGSMDVRATGKQSDYSYSLECGIGRIQIGEDEYSGLGREKEIINPGADRYMDLECGIGTVNIEFS